MKTIVHKFVPLTSLMIAGLLLTGTAAKAISYAGNGNTSFGGAVGNGTLSVTDDGTNITFSFIAGGGLGGNDLVVYIDSVTGGFSDTSGFSDAGDGGRKAVSGYDPSNGRSTMTFTNGFVPEYALDIQGGYASLFALTNGGNYSFNWITGGTQTGSPYTLTISAAQIGLTPGTTATIKIFGTFISESGYRSQEAIAGNDYGPFGSGWNPFTQTAYVTYTFAAPPSPSYPVAFSVDMTEQIASSAFDPNADTLYVAGTFQTNAWSGIPMSPTVDNTNIYTVASLDYNPTNTPEFFKFSFYHAATTSTIYEDQDNRPFTLTAPGVTNPLVYFSDLAATPSATTNYVSFSIDMGPQIYLGHFNPDSGDTIQVLGTMQNPKWTVATFLLTNNPSSPASNIYSGSIADGNYPGSFENYKFVIVSTTVTNYESGNNRVFFTPTNSGTLPLAYFNNVSTYGAVPITFQVDMTLPLAMGMFVPTNGDTVSAAGTFQTNQWTPGVFVLTNNPSGANPNLYTGTYTDRNQPNSGEQYKFQINTNGGGTAWESIGNRTFLLGSTAQVLPQVLWNNASTNYVIMAPTLVTFTVDMTGATDVYGNPFDVNNDAVVVDGNYCSPEWQVMNNATYENPLVFTANVMGRVGSSLIFTNSYTVAAGHSYQVLYKYGIYHDTVNINTNVDNEAAPYMNHTRYIRTTGTYNFPTDIFGQQRTNAASATEISFGNLAIAAPVAGKLPISWLGLPSVRLQSCTNLTTPVWLDVPGTVGLGSTNVPPTGNQEFFRLLQPE